MTASRITARPPGILSLAEAATATGRNPELLRRWCVAGRLSCERVGRDWRIGVDQLERIEAMPRRGGHPLLTSGTIEDLDVLPASLREEVRGCLEPDEDVRVVVLGTEDAAIVATHQRVFVARDGVLWKDPATGDAVAWPLERLRRVQIEVGAASGVLVLTPRDPDDRALVLVLARPHLGRAQAAADRLRDLLELAGSYDRPE